jgi:transposase-like protein
MPVGKHTDPQMKAEILQQIRHNGMRVADASEKYSVGSKAIYRWLREGVVNSDRNLVLEVNRLKKELEIAYRIIGRATAEMQRSKS